MVIPRFELAPDLEKEFREHAMMRFGHRKGSLKKAMEAAIRDWIDKIKKNPNAAATVPIEISAPPNMVQPPVLTDPINTPLHQAESLSEPPRIEVTPILEPPPVQPKLNPPTEVEIIRAQMANEIAAQLARKRVSDANILMGSGGMP